MRETWEYSLAHIPGSINFPLGELADCALELDAEDEIVICCHHGARSYEGAQILIESGFPRVANLIGGINAWSCLVDPSIPRYRVGKPRRNRGYLTLTPMVPPRLPGPGLTHEGAKA